MPIRTIKLKSSKKEVEEKAEEKRDKGGGFLGFGKKPPEVISYVRLLFFPAIYFTFEYTTEKGRIRKKTVIRSSSAAFLTAHLRYEIPSSIPAPRPYLAMLIKSEGLSDAEQGYFLKKPSLSEEEIIEKILAGFTDRLKEIEESINRGLAAGAEEGTQWHREMKQKIIKEKHRHRVCLNFDESADKIQDYVDTKTFYIPYWLVKLENDSIRYLVFDHELDEDSEFAETLTSNVKFRRIIESEAEEIS